MIELLIRFCLGGLIVSSFAAISDLFRPRTFAGLFGAAPSVALASLTVTIFTDGKQTAAIEARSMILGAVALLLYAATVSFLLVRFKPSALAVSLGGLLLWLLAALTLWYAI
jgi:hypothetical protein